MARAFQSLKAKALACIAQREHSRIELRRKLMAHAARQAREAAQSPLAGAELAAPSQDEIDAVLDWLIEKDLLSPQRFVDLRVQVRSARFGNLRIRHELAQHGHALDADALRALEASELARARAVWTKRFGDTGADAASRAKQARFLSARGFSAEVVRHVVAGNDDD